jgi:hypothetical protein
MIGIYVYHAS